MLLMTYRNDLGIQNIKIKLQKWRTSSDHFHPFLPLSLLDLPSLEIERILQFLVQETIIDDEINLPFSSKSSLLNPEQPILLPLSFITTLQYFLMIKSFSERSRSLVTVETIYVDPVRSARESIFERREDFGDNVATIRIDCVRDRVSDDIESRKKVGNSQLKSLTMFLLSIFPFESFIE